MILSLILFLGTLVHTTTFPAATIQPGQCVKKTTPIVHSDTRKYRRLVYTNIVGGVPDTLLISSVKNSNDPNILDEVDIWECNQSINPVIVPEVTIRWIVRKEKN
jgi:hypothetical protein